VPDRGLRLRAWAVHVLTASGVAFDFAVLALLCQPQPDPRTIFLLLIVPVVIDGVDGPLARRWAVTRWAARIDGRTIDDIVDYLTFTLVPLVLAWRMAWLPEPAAAYAVVACIASLFGFANAAAKQEEDGFFLGFPSYWNVFVFYAGIWATQHGPALPGLLCLLLSALTVLPVRFVYPNLAPPPWRWPILGGALVWLVLLAAMLPAYPRPAPVLLWASLVYPAFYVWLSVVLDRRARRRGAGAPARPV
jgi:phosphatidylcholine synthase